MTDTGSRSLALIGSGGTGVMTAGQILLDAAARAGLYGLMTRSYGPQIRGGEAAAILRLGSTPLHNQDDTLDILLAFDWGNIERFSAELPLAPGNLVIHDPAAGAVPDVIAQSGARLLAIPFQEQARALKRGRVNMLGLGLLGRLTGLAREDLQAAVTGQMQGKGEDILEQALACLEAGERACDMDSAPIPSGKETQAERWALSGNEAVALGALRGGVRFCAAYPITPSTDIVEWLAEHLPALGGNLVQGEDELATINMCLGASYGGVPSMTATSGPGLSLMVESIGLGVAAELPVLVVDVMRGGPSTGIPTKSEQSDLDIALYGVHGDAPHLVLAPNTISDCVIATQWAVGLSERLQTPAIVLSDQNMAQARAVLDAPELSDFADRRTLCEQPEDEYRRYALTVDGISPMTLPGTRGGQYVAEGLAHDVQGRPSSRTEDHLEQLDKRRDKLLHHDFGDRWADTEGTGRTAILTWGSLTGPAREALSRAADRGLNARLISIRLLAPAQPQRLAELLDGVDRLLVVEQTHSAQFHRYLRAHYTLPPQVHTLHRPGPVPIRPGEILRALEEISA